MTTFHNALTWFDACPSNKNRPRSSEVILSKMSLVISNRKISSTGLAPIPLTSRPSLYTICSHGHRYIGEALTRGWGVVARCVRGREDGPASRSSREFSYRRELDLETLVCTRGRAFPLSSLESRLRCPRCGNRRMVVMFETPSHTATGRQT